jgi:hypothetical protein
MSETDRTRLRFTKELFHHFSMGYHLCIDDGELFNELTTNETHYRELFSSLGFQLSSGSSGIYYFEPDKEKTGVNHVSKKFTVFMAVLYDYLADLGKDPVSAVIEERFVVNELPHLRVDQYRKILEKAGIVEEADLLRTLMQLQKYGFLDLKDNFLIMFKKSASRFTALFAEIVELPKTESAEEDIFDEE